MLQEDYADDALPPRWLANLLLTILAVCFGLSGDYGNADQGSFVLPAAQAFFIWAAIYITAVVFAVWQALPRQRRNRTLIALGYAPAVSYALAGLWSRVDRVGVLELSVAAIAATLVVIGVLLFRLARSGTARNDHEHWMLDFPLTLFAGWTVVAAGVNLTEQFLRHGASAAVAQPQLWALAIIILVGWLGWVGSGFERLRPGLAIAIGWGLAWIAIEQFPHSALIGIAASLAAAESVFAGVVRWHPVRVPAKNEGRLA